MMMAFRHRKYLLFTLALLFGHPAVAQDFQCRPYEIVEPEFTGPEKYSSGLLWKISKDNRVLGHIFGTIHVDDSDVRDLPGPVLNAFNSSSAYAMEVVPTPDDAIEFSMSMFSMDGSRLDRMLPAQIFDKTATVLERHGITREMVVLMKPWAAYIIMSYPANMGLVLDLHLLHMAQKNKIKILGLESSDEQISIFSELEMDHQIQLLTDTACHHDTVVADFDALKKLYLQRDLEGLYVYGQRYSFGDDSIYEEISGELIEERNIRMVERMADVLDSGGVFIAVGAMHLPGENGILNLLEKNAYKITREY